MDLRESQRITADAVAQAIAASCARDGALASLIAPMSARAKAPTIQRLYFRSSPRKRGPSPWFWIPAISAFTRVHSPA